MGYIFKQSARKQRPVKYERCYTFHGNKGESSMRSVILFVRFHAHIVIADVMDYTLMNCHVAGHKFE